MFRQFNNLLLVSFCFLFFLISGCGFMDLRPIGYSTIPEEAGGIIPDPFSPLCIRFDTAMHEMETQSALQVSGPSGSVEGDFIWKENELLFVPESPWFAGLRYVMKLSGTARSKDGRELLLSRDIPFFAISRSTLPYLESFSPADGASTGIFGPDEIVLTYVFSESMDRQSTETAFSCEGLGDKSFEWLNDDKTLTVLSKNSLSPWTPCRWTISEKAMSRSGAPLVREVSGRFTTDEDRVLPKLIRVMPLVKSENKGSWGFWIPVDVNLENGLGHEQALGMEFSKAMDGESLRRAFNFEPSLPGRVEQPGPARAVFIPDRNTEPETIYTLKISRDLKDEGGLKMEEDQTLSFYSDIPFLKILSFGPDGAGNHLEPKNREVFTVPINDGNGEVLRFTVQFSLPFSKDEQNEAAFRISLQPFFPGILKPVSLRFAHWSSPYLLRMEWEGVETGKEGESHYYRLSLPGGRNGLSNGNGSYLKEDTFFVIEAVDQ